MSFYSFIDIFLFFQGMLGGGCVCVCVLSKLLIRYQRNKTIKSSAVRLQYTKYYVNKRNQDQWVVCISCVIFHFVESCVLMLVSLSACRSVHWSWICLDRKVQNEIQNISAEGAKAYPFIIELAVYVNTASIALTIYCLL